MLGKEDGCADMRIGPGCFDRKDFGNRLRRTLEGIVVFVMMLHATFFALLFTQGISSSGTNLSAPYLTTSRSWAMRIRLRTLRVSRPSSSISDAMIACRILAKLFLHASQGSRPGVAGLQCVSRVPF